MTISMQLYLGVTEQGSVTIGFYWINFKGKVKTKQIGCRGSNVSYLSIGPGKKYIGIKTIYWVSNLKPYSSGLIQDRFWKLFKKVEDFLLAMYSDTLVWYHKTTYCVNIALVGCKDQIMALVAIQLVRSRSVAQNNWDLEKT